MKSNVYLFRPQLHLNTDETLPTAPRCDHCDCSTKEVDDQGRGLIRGMCFAFLPALGLWGLVIWAITRLLR